MGRVRRRPHADCRSERRRCQRLVGCGGPDLLGGSQGAEDGPPYVVGTRYLETLVQFVALAKLLLLVLLLLMLSNRCNGAGWRGGSRRGERSLHVAIASGCC